MGLAPSSSSIVFVFLLWLVTERQRERKQRERILCVFGFSVRVPGHVAKPHTSLVSLFEKKKRKKVRQKSVAHAEAIQDRRQ